jgi:Fe-S-cluster containining protein
MWNGAAYDCQQCGACCTNQESVAATGYVCLASDESKQMKRLGLTVVRAGNSVFLGTRGRTASRFPVCVVLHGQIGGSCGCTIYDRRPFNCRKFEVGSPLCEAARTKAGLSD